MYFIAKDKGVFCGGEVIKGGFHLLDERIQTTINIPDGREVEEGQILAVASGTISNLLMGERVILNLVQRMSGIATQTKEAVSILNSTHTKYVIREKQHLV